MAKARGVEAKLAHLRTLRTETAGPQLTAELRKALADSSNLVVAEAAEQIGDRRLTELEADLATAFERFLIDPVATDKVCLAKNAIVESLNKLEYEREEVFLQGVHHIQKEPAWPKPVDTADQLRANCAFGLVRMRYREVLLVLADLLADKEHVVRTAAVQALGHSALAAAAPLLRFKIHVGDEEPTVTAECLTSLVRLQSVEAFPFVTRFLYSSDELLREAAVLALGESRRPEAFDLLKPMWLEGRADSIREATLLAISMLRLPAAFDFLLGILETEQAAVARLALTTLAIHLNNLPLRDRIAAIVEKRSDEALKDRFRKKFLAAT